MPNIGAKREVDTPLKGIDLGVCHMGRKEILGEDGEMTRMIPLNRAVNKIPSHRSWKERVSRV